MKKTLALKELALFAFSVAINEGVETDGRDVAKLGVVDVSTLEVAVVPTLGVADALVTVETYEDSSLELVK